MWQIEKWASKFNVVQMSPGRQKWGAGLVKTAGGSAGVVGAHTGKHEGLRRAFSGIRLC